MSRLVALLAVCLLLAGCGGAGGGERAGGGDAAAGAASLWITRDRGAVVLHEGRVEAGRSALQALRSAAEVETRYGGRFVHSIDGVEGSLEDGRDWFFFVNGVLADRGAAEYRLRAGDVLWWDYRRWSGEAEVEVVVGAFPEPFLHGYDGVVRPGHVRFERPEQRAAARALGRVIRAVSVARSGRPVPAGDNVLVLAAGRPRFEASADGPTGPFRFELAGERAAMRLARDPSLARFRYEGLP